MPGKVIGTSLNLGYEGNISRNPENIITARRATEKIYFGDPVILNSDNSYSKFGASNVDADFVGVAVREVKQAISYSDSACFYEENERCDVLTRGSVVIKVNNGTPTAGGKVYIRIAENGSISNGVIGKFEAEADSANTVEITNARFTTGKVDANGMAEITILERRA